MHLRMEFDSGVGPTCYWLNFDQTLEIVSWDHLWQKPTVTVMFVQAKFVLVTFVHIKNISGVTNPILTKLSLGPSLTDANWYLSMQDLSWWHICPHQEYLSSYWPNFYQTFLPNFLTALLFVIQNFFVIKFFWPNNFLTQIFVHLRFTWHQNVFCLNLSVDQAFFDTELCQA